MRSRREAVRQQGFVRAASVEQRIVQDGETTNLQGAFRHLTLVVDPLGNAGNGAIVPGEYPDRKGRRGAERVANDTAKNRRVKLRLFKLGVALTCGCNLDSICNARSRISGRGRKIPQAARRKRMRLSGWPRPSGRPPG